MLRRLLRGALRLAGMRSQRGKAQAVPKPDNPSPYKPKPKGRVDFGKRGKEVLPAASRRKSAKIRSKAGR